MKSKLECLQTVSDLRGYDHAFLSPEVAEKLSKPFGFKAITSTHLARPNEHKGLTFKNGAKEAEGIGAHDLAMEICDKAGIQYDSKFGRGSQLRACCDALEQWLKDSE
jgi:hypothetical protein